MAEEDHAFKRLDNWRKQANECAVIIEGRPNTFVYKFKSTVRGGYLIYRPGSLLDYGVEDKMVSTSNYNGKSAGRLAITMQLLGQEVDFGGTAFVVAKLMDDGKHTLILQTAAHNTRPMDRDGQPPMQLSYSSDWDFSERAHDPGGYVVCSEIASGRVGDLDMDPQSNVKLQWRMQNDIAFLKAHVAPALFDSVICLAPVISVAERGVGVIGFPSKDPDEEIVFPQKQFWKEEEKQKYKGLNALWTSSIFFGYQSLVMSVGKHQYVNGPIGIHTATSVPGFSGSPLTVLGQYGTYAGMHIGGPTQVVGFTELQHVNHNTVLNNSHPVFIELYKRHVYPHIQRADLHPEAVPGFDEFVAKYLV